MARLVGDGKRLAKTFYDVLGVRPDAEDVVIRAAYRALMLRYHPDTNQSSAAEAHAKQINQAYETLSDPARRSEYDAQLESAELPGAQSAPFRAPAPPRPSPSRERWSADGAARAAKSPRSFAWILGLIAIAAVIGTFQNIRSPPRSTGQSAQATTVAVQSPTPGEPIAAAPAPDPEVAFRAFLDARLGAAARQFGGPGSTASYKILYSGDLNSDGIQDYVIYNETPGFCGSGGCSAEVYVGHPGTQFTEVDAPDLFGAGAVLVSGRHGRWKDIVTVETGERSSYSSYTRLIFEPGKSRYTALRSEFCGGLNFSACDNPVILCEIDGKDLDLSPNAEVYFAPVDEISAIAGSLSDTARVPQPSPREFNWISAESPDGNWFLVHFKFSGVRFVRASDVRGRSPLPPKDCR